MAMESIEELFQHALKDILGGEQALVDALEQMTEESSDPEIKRVYTQHRKET
jgi:ferritin-like metal-binding protein YciE